MALAEHRGARPAVLVPTLVLVAATTSVVSSLGAPLIPTVARVEGVSLSTAQWLLTAALLVGAVVTPLLGRLADGARQKQVVLVSLAIVLLGCILSAAARGFALVVTGRALQGVGLGLVPVTMAIVRRHLPSDIGRRTIAALSISSIIGVGLGYPLTGFIADAFGFHGAYWFGAITIVMSLVVCVIVLPSSPPMAVGRFDVLGGVMLALAVTGISVFLSEGGVWGWTSGPAIAVLGGGLVCLVFWIPYELRCREPLIELRQIRHRSVLTADVSAFLICVVMYLFIPVVVEFTQIPRSTGYGFGTSIVVAGLVLVPLSVGTFLASRARARYERRFGIRTMIPLGSVAFAISSGFFAFEHRALWEAFAVVGFAGIGTGFTFAAMPGLVVRAVPAAETGSALGLYQLLRSIGLSVGSALGAALLAIYTTKGHTYPAAGGFRAALLVGCAICLATAVVSYVLTGRDIDGVVVAGETAWGESHDEIEGLPESAVQESPL